jgi:hypothetical protein
MFDVCMCLFCVCVVLCAKRKGKKLYSEVRTILWTHAVEDSAGVPHAVVNPYVDVIVRCSTATRSCSCLGIHPTYKQSADCSHLHTAPHPRRRHSS